MRAFHAWTLTQSWLVPRQPIKYQFAESPIEIK